jgi:hypothetical protein
MSTQNLIAQIWETLEWRKTLQAAFLLAVAGVTTGLVLTILEVAAHLAGIATIAGPVSISVTAAVTYQAAHRRRR